MVRNLTRVRKNKSKGKKMQTRKRTTTKKGGKKQTKQNKKHNKKQGGRKTYKKRGGDNGDSDNMIEKSIDEIPELKIYRQGISKHINIMMDTESTRDFNYFYHLMKELHTKYNLGGEVYYESDLVDPVNTEKEAEQLMLNLNTDLQKHIFGDRKPKILTPIDEDTLINLPTFISFFKDELTIKKPENKSEIRRRIKREWSNRIDYLNRAIKNYNDKLKELKLVESVSVPEPEPQNKGFFRNPFSRNRNK